MKYKLKINKNKKGTEKPIEIFLALFIILAVSMVMLKLFQSQIQDKTKEMKDVARETELEQAIEDATLLCQRKCTDAIQEQCSAKSVVTYCVQKLTGNSAGITDDDLKYLDLNKDGMNTFQTSTAYTGVCEDAVFCPYVYTCICGQELTADYCHKVMCKFWKNSGLDEEYLLNLTYNKADSTSCINSQNYDPNLMWNRNINNCSQTS
jgi:hypothetical protein